MAQDFPQQTFDPGEYVSIATMAKRLDVGLSTAWRKVHDGFLPPATIKLGSRCSRWRWGDVLEHLSKRGAR